MAAMRVPPWTPPEVLELLSAWVTPPEVGFSGDYAWCLARGRLAVWRPDRPGSPCGVQTVPADVLARGGRRFVGVAVPRDLEAEHLERRRIAREARGSGGVGAGGVGAGVSSPLGASPLPPLAPSVLLVEAGGAAVLWPRFLSRADEAEAGVFRGASGASPTPGLETEVSDEVAMVSTLNAPAAAISAARHPRDGAAVFAVATGGGGLYVLRVTAAVARGEAAPLWVTLQDMRWVEGSEGRSASRSSDEGEDASGLAMVATPAPSSARASGAPGSDASPSSGGVLGAVSRLLGFGPPPSSAAFPSPQRLFTPFRSPTPYRGSSSEAAEAVSDAVFSGIAFALGVGPSGLALATVAASTGSLGLWVVPAGRRTWEEVEAEGDGDGMEEGDEGEEEGEEEGEGDGAGSGRRCRRRRPPPLARAPRSERPFELPDDVSALEDPEAPHPDYLLWRIEAVAEAAKRLPSLAGLSIAAVEVAGLADEADYARLVELGAVEGQRAGDSDGSATDLSALTALARLSPRPPLASFAASAVPPQPLCASVVLLLAPRPDADAPRRSESAALLVFRAPLSGAPPPEALDLARPLPLATPAPVDALALARGVPEPTLPAKPFDPADPLVWIDALALTPERRLPLFAWRSDGEGGVRVADAGAPEPERAPLQDAWAGPVAAATGAPDGWLLFDAREGLAFLPTRGEDDDEGLGGVGSRAGLVGAAAAKGAGAPAALVDSPTFAPTAATSRFHTPRASPLGGNAPFATPARHGPQGLVATPARHGSQGQVATPLSAFQTPVGGAAPGFAGFAGFPSAPSASGAAGGVGAFGAAAAPRTDPAPLAGSPVEDHSRAPLPGSPIEDDSSAREDDVIEEGGVGDVDAPSREVSPSVPSPAFRALGSPLSEAAPSTPSPVPSASLSPALPSPPIASSPYEASLSPSPVGYAPSPAPRLASASAVAEASRLLAAASRGDVPAEALASDLERAGALAPAPLLEASRALADALPRSWRGALGPDEEEDRLAAKLRSLRAVGAALERGGAFDALARRAGPLAAAQTFAGLFADVQKVAAALAAVRAAHRVERLAHERVGAGDASAHVGSLGAATPGAAGADAQPFATPTAAVFRAPSAPGLVNTSLTSAGEPSRAAFAHGTQPPPTSAFAQGTRLPPSTVFATGVRGSPGAGSPGSLALSPSTLAAFALSAALSTAGEVAGRPLRGGPAERPDRDAFSARPSDAAPALWDAVARCARMLAGERSGRGADAADAADVETPPGLRSRWAAGNETRPDVVSPASASASASPSSSPDLSSFPPASRWEALVSLHGFCCAAIDAAAAEQLSQRSAAPAAFAAAQGLAREAAADGYEVEAGSEAGSSWLLATWTWACGAPAARAFAALAAAALAVGEDLSALPAKRAPCDVLARDAVSRGLDALAAAGVRRSEIEEDLAEEQNKGEGEGEESGVGGSRGSIERSGECNARRASGPGKPPAQLPRASRSGKSLLSSLRPDASAVESRRDLRSLLLPALLARGLVLLSIGVSSGRDAEAVLTVARSSLADVARIARAHDVHAVLFDALQALEDREGILQAMRESVLGGLCDDAGAAALGSSESPSLPRSTLGPASASASASSGVRAALPFAYFVFGKLLRDGRTAELLELPATLSPALEAWLLAGEGGRTPPGKADPLAAALAPQRRHLAWLHLVRRGEYAEAALAIERSVAAAQETRPDPARRGTRSAATAAAAASAAAAAASPAAQPLPTATPASLRLALARERAASLAASPGWPLSVSSALAARAPHVERELVTLDCLEVAGADAGADGPRGDSANAVPSLSPKDAALACLSGGAPSPGARVGAAQRILDAAEEAEAQAPQASALGWAGLAEARVEVDRAWLGLLGDERDWIATEREDAQNGLDASLVAARAEELATAACEAFAAAGTDGPADRVYRALEGVVRAWREDARESVLEAFRAGCEGEQADDDHMLE